MGIFSAAIALFSPGGMGKWEKLPERPSNDEVGTKSSILFRLQPIVDFTTGLEKALQHETLLVLGKAWKSQSYLSPQPAQRQRRVLSKNKT